MVDDVFGIVGSVQAGAFRVDEVVAEGGFAVIYRAYHSAFRAKVALKCLKIPRALSEAEQKEFLEKFREEAELLFRLSSAISTVVRPLHVGTLSTDRRFVPFIALEWLDGQTLDKLVSTRAISGEPPLSLVSAVKLLTPVADALCRAHAFPTEEGTVAIVHRDLKPENIFIATGHRRDTVKILDFGIAKVKNATNQMVGRQSANESPLAAFTPAYGAPEQWLPKRYGQTGPWTDVWGLAITVVEAVCGHSPIDGDVVQMMSQVTDTEQRPTPRNEGVRTDQAVDAVFARALAVDPRDRFHDIGSFWNELCVTLGLPETVGEKSPSLLPPPMAPVSRRGATTVVSATPPPVEVEVPDLALAPRSGPVSRKPPVSAKEPKRASAPKLAYGATPLDALGDPTPSSSLEMDFSDRGPYGGGFSARPRAAASVRHVAPLSPIGSRRRLELGAPLRLLGLSVLMMAGDWAYAAINGEVLHVGPARTVWVAGPLAGIGVVLLLVRLLSVAD